MSETAQGFKKQLAALSVDDRAELAHFLLQSLDDEIDSDEDAAWEAELNRRGEEIKSGQAKGYSIDEVFADLNENQL